MAATIQQDASGVWIMKVSGVLTKASDFASGPWSQVQRGRRPPLIGEKERDKTKP